MDGPPLPWLTDAAAVARPWMRTAAVGEVALPVAVLRSPDRLPGLLHADREDCDRGACSRAAASVWSKHLMSALLPEPMLSALEGVAERAAGLRAALFLAPHLAGYGAPNPLRDEISYVATPVPEYPTMRRRRICCLRDRLGQPLCASCPKITAEARDAVLRAAAARAVATRPSTRPRG